MRVGARIAFIARQALPPPQTPHWPQLFMCCLLDWMVSTVNWVFLGYFHHGGREGLAHSKRVLAFLAMQIADPPSSPKFPVAATFHKLFRLRRKLLVFSIRWFLLNA